MSNPRTTDVIVSLSDFGQQVYIGRQKGERAREKLKLDSLETSSGVITIAVPPDAYAINSSFILGLVGSTIARLGSRDAFFSKYSFTATDQQRKDFLNEALDDAIEHALIKDRPLLSTSK